jgi:DNA-binding LacI/PurR family transcriptional regulator
LKLGYTPNTIARSLVLNKTYTIGVVIPEISHSFFPEAIRGIDEVAHKAGYHLILMHSAENNRRERDAIQTLEGKRVDGILLSASTGADDRTYYERVVRIGVPLVFFDRCIRGVGATCVSIDDEASAVRITEHLISHGYTRLAHLSGPMGVSIGIERLSGFREAARRNGITVPNEAVIESGFHEEGGYAAMKKALSLPPRVRPRAVVAVNDPAAFGAIKAVQDAGLRVPDDVAVVGFSDDIRAPLISVPLTTVRQPAYQLGRLAAQKLLKLIEGRGRNPEEIIVSTEIVLRDSCGHHPASD